MNRSIVVAGRSSRSRLLVVLAAVLAMVSPLGAISSAAAAPSVAGSNPVGSFEAAQGIVGGFIFVKGWMLDPDAPTMSGQVHVYIDGPAAPGRRAVAIGAAMSRPDVGSGNAHGFSTAIGSITPGAHTLYLYGINNAGGGGNPLLGTRTATVPANVAGSPIGSFDSATGFADGTARLAGWAIDPDAQAAATSIHVYIDGMPGPGVRGINTGPAWLARLDVAKAYPNAGPNHGFNVTITSLTPGSHTFLAYAANTAGAGSNPLLGARTVTVPAARVPSKVSLSIPAGAGVGTAITASTQVTDQYGGAMSGRTVTLQKMQSGTSTWKSIKQLTTGSTGIAAHRFANGVTGYYRWVSMAVAGGPSKVSPYVKVTSTARIAGRRPATSMTHGRSLKVSGSMYRVPSPVVYIQYRYAWGMWRTGARATVRGTAVSGRIRLKLRKTTYTRLYVKAGTSYGGAVSRTYATKVR